MINGTPKEPAHDAASAKLLEAAAGLVGGRRPLAHQLGISEALLAKCLAGGLAVPPHVLLRTVDIIEAARWPGVGEWSAGTAQQSDG